MSPALCRDARRRSPCVQPAEPARSRRGAKRQRLAPPLPFASPPRSQAQQPRTARQTPAPDACEPQVGQPSQRWREAGIHNLSSCVSYDPPRPSFTPRSHRYTAMGQLLSRLCVAAFGEPPPPSTVLVPPLFKPAGVSQRSLCVPCQLAASINCLTASQKRQERLYNCFPSRGAQAADAGLPGPCGRNHRCAETGEALYKKAGARRSTRDTLTPRCLAPADHPRRVLLRPRAAQPSGQRGRAGVCAREFRRRGGEQQL